mmetsp:Transcript_43505/g.105469  ORF Transcript_43505/g.105469 Transcript_43505/m.105469 type:complete len:522 (+) Transcript_43505:229-1794(+)
MISDEEEQYNQHQQQHYHGERSPLFIKQKSSTASSYENLHDNASGGTTTAGSSAAAAARDDIQSITSHTTKGSSSITSVGINLAKTAAGTGILALPYACREGGLLLFIFGTIVIAVWNVWGVSRFCECLELLRQSQDQYSHTPRAPFGTEPLAKIAYYATTTSKGDEWGLTALDVMLLSLLCGIVIAYENAIRAFSPYTTGSDAFDAVILASILTPLCMTDDLSKLSKLSHMGLVVLGMAILVIAGYGVVGYDPDNYTDTQVFTWLPRNGLEGVSRWFGCVVFGFGIVPLTFNFRESMQEPQRLPKVALVSMLLVATMYIITGVGLLYLYPVIDADVLSQIPNNEWLATITRLAMIVVVVATAPLLLIPCSLIVEGKLHNHDSEIHPRTRLLTRICLCFGTVAVSVMVPEFVLVLSFVGCFSVALVSFCVPPLLHCILLIRHQSKAAQLQSSSSSSRAYSRVSVSNPISNGGSNNSIGASANGSNTSAIAVDCVALLFGIITTVVTTLFTIRKAMNEGKTS